MLTSNGASYKAHKDNEKNEDSSHFEDKEEITEQHHEARKTFLKYIAMALLLGLADLFYREPLYALTLEYVPGWQAQYTRESFMI